MSKASKGPRFEREFCPKLSLWYSETTLAEPTEDLFWRTANSGGRATMRGKSNRTTRGQHGDVGATDQYGEPLIKLITWELKCGYSSATIADLIYRSEAKKKPCIYEQWITKLQKTAEKAETLHYALVHKRNFKKPVLLVPLRLIEEIDEYMSIFIDSSVELNIPKLREPIFVCGLDDFLGQVTGECMLEIAKHHKLVKRD